MQNTVDSSSWTYGVDIFAHSVEIAFSTSLGIKTRRFEKHRSRSDDGASLVLTIKYID